MQNLGVYSKWFLGLSVYFYNELWHFHALLSPLWMRYEFYHLVMFIIYPRVEFTKCQSMCYKPTDPQLVTSAEQDRSERVRVKPLQMTTTFPLLYRKVKVTPPSQSPPSLSFHNLTLHSRAMSVVTLQCAGQWNKASVAGRSNFSPQSSERLWFPRPSIQRDTVPGYFYQWWSTGTWLQILSST
jgi:hypothetical protein